MRRGREGGGKGVPVSSTKLKGSRRKRGKKTGGCNLVAGTRGVTDEGGKE